METNQRERIKQITFCNLFGMIFVSCLMVSLYAFMKVKTYEMDKVPIDIIKQVLGENESFIESSFN